MFVGKSKGYEVFPKDFDIENFVDDFGDWIEDLTTEKVSVEDSLYAAELFESGMEYYNYGEYQEASWDFEYAFEINPLFYKAQYFLAKSFLFDEQYYDAYYEFEDLLENTNDYDSAYLFLAQSYFYVGYYFDAETTVEIFLDKFPNSDEGLYWLANIDYYNGYTTSAINYLTEIINQSPDFYDAYILLSEIYLYQEYYTESISILRKAYNLTPNNSSLCFSLGKTYYDLNNTDSAIYFLKQSTTLDNNNFEAYNYYALSLLDKNRYDEALNAIEIALEYSYSYDFLETRGRIYLKNGDYLNAKNDFVDCYDYTYNEVFLLLIAESYEKLEDYKDAIEYYSLFLDVSSYDDSNRTIAIEKIEYLEQNF